MDPAHVVRPDRDGDAHTADDSDSDLDAHFFQEPDDFRPKTPPPTIAKYTLPAEATVDGAQEVHIELSLVGSHPLWGHHLWNAAPTLSDYLARSAVAARRIAARNSLGTEPRQTQPLTCTGKCVLELGAAAGLPSIVAHLLGADLVVGTDYPDPDLVSNLAHNLQRHERTESQRHIYADGYIWGADATSIKRHLSSIDREYYDIVFMSDLIFNHQAHQAMLDTLDLCLPPASRSTGKTSDDEQALCTGPDIDATAYDGPQALVFFTHHRPHLAHRDVEFFATARARGWIAEEIGQWKMAPMFPDDPGSAEVRATVHGWRLSR